MNYVSSVTDNPNPSEFPNRLNEWSIKADQLDGRYLTVIITPPIDCIVGRWSMSIESRLITNRRAYNTYSVGREIFVLFNPFKSGMIYEHNLDTITGLILTTWLITDFSGDDTYLADPDSRDEYILNDTGIIFTGNHHMIDQKPWNFSQVSCSPAELNQLINWLHLQFEKNVLDCIEYLFNAGKLKYAHRKDVVQVCRFLSKIVNYDSTFDEGMIFGRWSHKYYGGTPPTYWTGSDEIIRRYLRTKKPVKYGQCWVFAGVLTTSESLPLIYSKSSLIKRLVY